MLSTSIKPSQVARPEGTAPLRPSLRLAAAAPTLATLLLSTCCLALTACGAATSDPPALRVGATTISKATISHWMDVANATDQKSVVDGVDLVRVALKPPQFSACVKRLKAGGAEIAGRPVHDERALRSACHGWFSKVRARAVRFLISAYWSIGQAEALGIGLNDREVRHWFEVHKEFPEERAVPIYLHITRQHFSDLLFTFKAVLDSQRLRERALAGSAPVTHAQILRYYQANRATLGVPEHRDLVLVRTRTQSAIAAAWRALHSGQSFDAVARRYSIEYPGSLHGGIFPGIVPGQEEAKLSRAIFAAHPNVLSGPVAIPMGYYIFKVKHITPGRPKPLSALEGQIRTQLAKEHEQATLQRASDQLRAAWRPKTHCSPGYVIVKCAGQQGEEAGIEPLQPRHFPLIQNFI
jgi:hypothetical protein